MKRKYLFVDTVLALETIQIEKKLASLHIGS